MSNLLILPERLQAERAEAQNKKAIEFNAQKYARLFTLNALLLKAETEEQATKIYEQIAAFLHQNQDDFITIVTENSLTEPELP